MSILGEAARKLRGRYIEGLPAKRKVIEEALAASTAGQLDAEAVLRRIAHQIRGSAASYGFLQIDGAALRLEHADERGELERAAAELIVALHEAYRSESTPTTKILLIDDDPELGPLLESLFREENVELHQVMSAAAAHEELNSNEWSVIFVDLILPDADGRSLLTRIRGLLSHRDTPLIVLTAQTSSLVRNECAMYGIDDFIQKPIDPKTFAVGLTSILSRARALQTAAYDDSLTGLPNRVGFRRAFEPLRRLSERKGLPLSLALVDIDHFKRINDEHGHHFGDRALVAFTQRVASSVRSSDLIGRWGGDEFVLGFPEADAQTALELLERAAQALREQPALDEFGPLTFSGGVVQLGAGESLDFGLLRADQLLYQVKRAGRGRCVHTLEAVDDGRARVLFAEDDPSLARMVLRDLADDFDIVHVADGNAALAAAARETFDLVMLDYNMPERNGLEVVRELRQDPTYAKRPILLLTAVGSDAAVEQAFAAGADDYITKPYRRGPLIARLLRHLGRTATVSPTPRAAPEETVESKLIVLVCDLGDLARLGNRMRPSALIELANAYVTEVTRVVHAHSGQIQQRTGNSIIALFGVPSPSSADVVNAHQAAVEIQRAVARLGDATPISARVAIHSEPIEASRVADKLYLRGKGVSTITTIAQHVVSMAGAGEVISSEPTVQLLADRSSWPLDGPMPWRVDGRPLPLYRLRWKDLSQAAARG